MKSGELEAVFAQVEERWGRLDVLVHSIAFAPKEDLQGGLLDCSAEGFAKAMDISCHSFIRMAKLAAPLMTEGGALFAMYVANAQAKVFTSTMTYEILLIVVIGGIGSVSGSVIGTFLYVACSEWWLRFLDRETYIGSFKVPLLRSGFRMVVFSVVIMIIVLFFSKGIMGEKELSWKGIGGLLKKRKKAAPAAEKED